MISKIYFYISLFLALFLAPLVANGLIYQNGHKNNFNASWRIDHQPFCIHSIPKCGTHFIQEIIQLMTPHDILVGAMEPQYLLHANVYNMVLRIYDPFTTSAERTALQSGYKIVAMVRDPRDALISILFYMKTFPKDVYNRDFFYVGPGFDNLSLDQQIKSLIIGDAFAHSYIQYYKDRIGWVTSRNTLMLKYEDLIGGTTEEDMIKRDSVKMLAQHIKLSLTPDHLEFILKNMRHPDLQDELAENKAFKRATTGNWKTFLNEEHKQLIKERIGDTLIWLGYEKDYNW